MRSLLLLVLAAAACTSRTSTTTTASGDSVRTDTVSSLADQPAPSSLAFSAVPGYNVLKTVALPDSVNFFLVANEAEFFTKFVPDKSAGANFQKPDFLINYVVGVVGKSTDRKTTIGLEKVEVADDINVYITIQRGEKQPSAAATQVFAIERRDGVIAMQFFVNGKKSTALMLTAL